MATTLFLFHREPEEAFWITINFEFYTSTCNKPHLGKAASETIREKEMGLLLRE